VINWIDASEGLTNIDETALATNDTDLYAGTSNGVFRSTDDAAHWVDASLKSTNVRVLFNNGQDLFAGSEGKGVFLSNDGGRNWRQINEGLDTKYAQSVYSISANDSNIYVGTYANGVFDRSIFDFKTSVVSRPQSKGNSFSIFPNPFIEALELHYRLDKSATVRIDIYDVLGRTIYSEGQGYKQEGENLLSIQTKEWASGSYYVRLSTPSGEVKTVKVIKE
jgi:photosystem II stability/assembly factor-like uncharacterized protein